MTRIFFFNVQSDNAFLSYLELFFTRQQGSERKMSCSSYLDIGSQLYVEIAIPNIFYNIY